MRRIRAQPLRHSRILIRRASKDLRKPASTAVPRRLWRIPRRAAHRRHPRTRRRERGRKLRLAIHTARRAHARIPRGHQNRHAARAQLREEIARVRCVCKRDGRLIVAIRNGERVGQLRGRQGEQVVQELEVRLVGIAPGAQELPAPCGAVVRVRHGCGYRACILDVEVRLDAGRGGGACAAVDGGAGEGLGFVGEVGVAVEEGCEVGFDGVFFEEAGDAEEADGLDLSGGEVVEVGEAGGRYASAGAAGDGLGGFVVDIVLDFVVLGNGGAQLLETEEGGGLDHVYMAFEAGW